MATESYLGIPGNHIGRTFDKLLEFTPAGTVVAAGPSAVINLGTGLIDADLVVDVFAGPAKVAMEFATDEAFTTPVVGAAVTLAAGRSIVPFRNLMAGAPDDRPFGFMRLDYGDAATLGAFIAKK